MAHSIRSAAVTIHLIVKATPHSHFALGNHGAPALRVMPEVSDNLHRAAVHGGKAVPPAMIQQLNAALNKIKKEG